MGTGPGPKVSSNTLYTPRVKKVLDFAQKEARALNHTYVGTEHILLGLFREGDGVGVVSRIQDPLHAVPVLTDRWHFADRWRLALGYTDPAVIGYGVALTWECSPHWEFTWAGQYHNARFRITDSGASTYGVGEEQSFILGTGAAWKLNRQFSINAFASAVVGGKLRIEDTSGNELQESQYDATPILAVRADLRF